jgi:hypothetical protein
MYLRFFNVDKSTKMSITDLELDRLNDDFLLTGTGTVTVHPSQFIKIKEKVAIC